MQNHYNFVFDEITNTYNFATKNEILYRIAFIHDSTFATISGDEIPNVFQLVVEKTTEGIEPYDRKVARTIEVILERFFLKVENSLIYICSDEDGKAGQRHEVFNRWYRKSKLRSEIIKRDNVMSFSIDENENRLLYTSFLFRKQNKNFEALLEIYAQIEDVLNGNK